MAAQKLLDTRCKKSARSDKKALTGDVSAITQSIEKADSGSGWAQTVVMKKSGSKGTLGKSLHNAAGVEGASEHVISRTKQAIQKMEAIEANVKPYHKNKVQATVSNHSQSKKTKSFAKYLSDMLGSQTKNSIMAEKMTKQHQQRHGGSSGSTPLTKAEHQRFLARFNHAAKEEGLMP